MPRKKPLVYGGFDAWWSDGACASLGRVCKIGNKMRSSVYLNEVEVVCWCSTTRPRHASGLGSAVFCRESRLPFFHAFRLLVHVHYLPRYNCYPLSPRQHGHMRCRLITTVCLSRWVGLPHVPDHNQPHRTAPRRNSSGTINTPVTETQFTLFFNAWTISSHADNDSQHPYKWLLPALSAIIFAISEPLYTFLFVRLPIEPALLALFVPVSQVLTILLLSDAARAVEL
jgi:hypothetical protein